jgi:hypothetical protein
MGTAARVFESKSPFRYFAASLSFFSLVLIFSPIVLAQTNPPPSDPHEMVTREPRILTKPAERSAALDLLARARQNFDLHDIASPYELKVSFETNGSAQYEGQWTMEQLSDGGSHWRWSAQLGDMQLVQIGADDRVYSSDPSAPVPLRVQLVRSILFRPVMHNVAVYEIRARDVEHDGKQMTCLLLSHSLPPNPAPRSWVEREDCIDPATGMLQVWSEAPGIYAIYDYAGATEFHGHTLPRQISIFEDGRPAVQVRVESLKDAPDLDPNLFKPTQEMLDAGEAFALASPSREPIRVDPSDGPTSRYFQPVIVHAIIDAEDGSVRDAEALQTSDRDLSRAALEMVKNTAFEPSGFQQEIFVNVQFHFPALRFGGPAIFHSSVRWVNLDHHGKFPPVRHPPPHPGK